MGLDFLLGDFGAFGYGKGQRHSKRLFSGRLLVTFVASCSRPRRDIHEFAGRLVFWPYDLLTYRFSGVAKLSNWSQGESKITEPRSGIREELISRGDRYLIRGSEPGPIYCGLAVMSAHRSVLFNFSSHERTGAIAF
jgi:hypothetical protein